MVSASGSAAGDLARSIALRKSLAAQAKTVIRSAVLTENES
jgi:hypothetical protein